MSSKVCPYPGLRPFTVDESFFFKGRDLHVRQIINKLETNKILILTGASGDGKSSLVYAGLIPSARAGFFRSKYNRWVFADFRPERSPLKNLAATLSASLKIGLEETEQELGYGFSSIIDLYKSSQFYIDESDPDWQKLPLEQRRKRTLGAANLFILADQFEELFTNSENYANGKASVEAYTTVNLLLETAKIALRDNLPIYIVCTLRSDFISQCIAFRGLPEAIGFSQFFVPRLNRSELQQVIEEPAILSGGRVSKRLKEILINELHDGFDQLPILQHTLKQVWWIANNGDEELDMIHLAKLGGIHSRFLTAEDKRRFDDWSESVNPILKNYLIAPSSNNVLNAHADYLYESAYEQYIQNTEWGDKNITADEAKLIVKIAFQCLTKIDQGRAVRNRTTLEEITHIVDLPHIKYDTVCGVINIFRLQSSTFLRPFINESDVATQFLSYDTVLDITHESLIRNWVNLQKWNEEELVNVSDYREFVVQLNRWLGSNKSRDFLLAIGPLSHFESWYERCKPNKYWLAKYDNSASDYRERLRITDALSAQCKDFLLISRQHFIQTERNKKRRNHILLICSLIVIVALSAFSYVAKMEKKNADKQRKLAEKQTSEAKFQQKRAIDANLIADRERLIAQQSAKNALLAKAQSDSARNLADIMRKIAENAKLFAYKEADNARAEKKNADEQRLIADEQRKLALQASDSAKMFSYLAIAQSLSYKANQKYEDKQVNLLMALQAYTFNKKHNGYSREQYLFHAFSTALKANGIKNSIPVSADYYSSCYFSKDKTEILTKYGKLLFFNLEQSKLLKESNLFDGKIPLNYSVFVSENAIIATLENRQSFYIELPSGAKFKLEGHQDYIRCASLSQSKNILATGGRDRLLLVYKKMNNQFVQSTVFKLSDRITALAVLDDEKTIYACTTEGSVHRIDLISNKEETITKLSSPALSLTVSPDGRFVAVGSSDGQLRLIDAKNEIKNVDLSVGSCGVRRITFHQKLNLIALAFDDKSIKVYSLNHLDHNPFNIKDIDQKILDIGFIDDRLFALMSDHSILFWETDLTKTASLAEKLINRNFTKDEWRIFVGEKIPYEKTTAKVQ